MKNPNNKELFAIYGAGDAGEMLLEVLKITDSNKVIAFLDDDKKKQGQFLEEIPIYNPSDFLGSTLKAENQRLPTILVAMPSLDQPAIKTICDQILKYGYNTKTIPSLEEIILGRSIDFFRKINPQSIIDREPIDPDEQKMQEAITGKRILVTGAGGSIGSEICRQTSLYNPELVVMLDISEASLYKIDQLLNSNNVTENSRFIPIIGSVLDKDHIDSIINKYEINCIYHAAAYKHVPLVESNPVEGVRTNILGTEIVASRAKKYRVENFVLISTDKAVRPTNIMGASKRIAESVVQVFSKNTKSTRYSIVRFGNVIGSSGSVIPKFIKQIEMGGPVTVTDPNITRYFMTIPEASQLVIQSTSMAKGGEVFLLEMGEPIKIVDIAHRVAELKGIELSCQPGKGQIKIEYSGLRPGEKLYEELFIDSDNAKKTNHEKIYKAEEPCPSEVDLKRALKRIKEACDRRETESLRRMLHEYVSIFSCAS